MFDFLRKRATPEPLAPLRTIDWNGHALDLVLDADIVQEVALDLDGAFFSSARADGDGRLHVAFAFAPTAAAVFNLLPRLGRDGPALLAQPLRVQFGQSGPARRVPGPQVPAQAIRMQAVPFGVDVAAIDVAIVVPVYDAPALVERCLDAVLAHTHGNARLIVIDDASPDPAIAPLLERYRDIAGVRVLRNDANRGFTATANRGIALAGRADVVLLNADAEVGANWLTGLRRAAHSQADVGTATAVSDNAGAFSVPELEQPNELPPCWTFEQSARAVWQQAGLAYPQLPTGNGFCLYIRRAVVDRVGALDEAAFPQGYGEENDFCQRAAQAGFRHLIAGNVLVRHARSMSFGEERRLALGRVGMAVLRQRWPNYEAEVGATLFSFERRVLDWRVRRAFADAQADDAPQPRVLAADRQTTAAAGGAVWHLRVSPRAIELIDAAGVTIAAAPCDAAQHALWDWLQAYAIECVVDTGTSPYALAKLAAALDIPVATTASMWSHAIARACSFPGDVR